MLLNISGLSVTVAGLTVVNGLSLDVPAGEVHAIMGPNGSGKSTLAKTLAGHPAYTITAGGIRLGGADLAALEPEAPGSFFSADVLPRAGEPRRIRPPPWEAREPLR